MQCMSDSEEESSTLLVSKEQVSQQRIVHVAIAICCASSYIL